MGLEERLAGLLGPLWNTSTLAELGVLVLCLVVAGLVSRLVRNGQRSKIWFGERGFDGALFPLLALLLAVLARWLLAKWVPIALFHLAVPILASLAVIRLAVRVLQATFPESTFVRLMERTLSWFVWVVMVLWLTGLLPQLLAEADAIHWKLGGSDVSLRSLIEGAVSAVAVLLLMLWVSATIEARLLAAQGVSISVRKIAANGTRALLLLVGLLLALSAAGIPLGALSVLGGAVGVGIGFGLQKLAANYVSGFVILAEHSIRIGDVVKVDGFEGRITDITTRYTVIRALNGRESIVPNELMITSRVESSTLADTRVLLTTEVGVAYGTDVEDLIPRLEAAVRDVPRVLPDPGPGVHLAGFGADGLTLRVLFWIADPENGTGSAQSEVNRAILRLLNAQGVEIPFPQRVVHMKTLPPQEAP